MESQLPQASAPGDAATHSLSVLRPHVASSSADSSVPGPLSSCSAFPAGPPPSDSSASSSNAARTFSSLGTSLSSAAAASKPAAPSPVPAGASFSQLAAAAADSPASLLGNGVCRGCSSSPSPGRSAALRCNCYCCARPTAARPSLCCCCCCSSRTTLEAFSRSTCSSHQSRPTTRLQTGHQSGAAATADLPAAAAAVCVDDGALSPTAAAAAVPQLTARRSATAQCFFSRQQHHSTPLRRHLRKHQQQTHDQQQQRPTQQRSGVPALPLQEVGEARRRPVLLRRQSASPRMVDRRRNLTSLPQVAGHLASPSVACAGKPASRREMAAAAAVSAERAAARYAETASEEGGDGEMGETAAGWRLSSPAARFPRQLAAAAVRIPCLSGRGADAAAAEVPQEAVAAAEAADPMRRQGGGRRRGTASAALPFSTLDVLQGDAAAAAAANASRLWPAAAAAPSHQTAAGAADSRGGGGAGGCRGPTKVLEKQQQQKQQQQKQRQQKQRQQKQQQHKQQQSWERVLWKKPQRRLYADNYLDDSFLCGLVSNARNRSYSYCSLCSATVVITQHLSLLIIFTVVYVRFRRQKADGLSLVLLSLLLLLFGHALRWMLQPSWRALANGVRSSLLGLGALRLAAPILRTLTESFSDDTVISLSVACFVLHIALADYSHVRRNPERIDESLTRALSINAALLANVVLASRLSSSTDVFGIFFFGIEMSALSPLTRRMLWQQHPRLFVYGVTPALILLTAALLLLEAPWSLVVLYLFCMFFITFVGPYWLINSQIYKNELRGPWDIAVVPTIS